MYGAAAYQQWKPDKTVHERLDSYYENYYQPLNKKSSKHPITNSHMSNECGEPSDNESRDPDHNPNKRPRGGKGRKQSLLDAMDEVMDISLRIMWRTTREELATALQKQEEEALLREREASRIKVLQWMGSTVDSTT